MTPRQSAAILFADVAGSSRLYKSLGDDRAQAMIGAIVMEMAEATRAHGGEVIKTIGDEIMASFETAESAVRAAIAIQQRRRDATPRVDARIGTHYGPTLVHDRDIFGEAVNDAAHLVSIARGGQIVTSSDTVEALPDELKARATRFDRVRLKGAREVSVIYLVDWEREDGEPQPGTRSPRGATEVISAHLDPRPSVMAVARLELHYRDQALSVGVEDLPFIVGRDPAIATLPVLSSVASRDHFHIDYRRGKFVLKDNSTNGTWVRLDGQQAAIYLRREEAPLTGPGTISIGRAIQDDDPHLIRFRPGSAVR